MAGSRNDATSTDDVERGAPRSRVEPFASLLGVETDAEVARRAGVSPETARIYRVRHGIPSASSRTREWHAAAERERAAPRDELPPEYTGSKGKNPEKRAEDPVRPAATLSEPSRPEPASDAPFRRGGQASPIDAHFHTLGKVSDSEVARLAGVSTAAVSQYRRRRGIPSSVAAGGVAQDALAAAAKPASAAVPVAQPAPAPAAAPPAAAPPAAAPPAAAPPAAAPVLAPGSQERGAPRAVAWLAVVRRGDAEQSYIVIGSDVSDAATRAVRLVEAGSEVLSVTRHMDALV